LNRVILSTPARLHFGLLDLNGEIGRIDGGVGLALESPHTLIEAEKADRVTAECREEPEIVGRIVNALEAVREHLGIGGAHINVRERPLAHVGMGSATQTLLGAAHALCMLYGVDESSHYLAKLVGRGGTSGIGVEAVRAGGFILDAGHAFRRGENSKHEYTPSGASAGIEPPPILARYDFPDWDVLVAVPLGEGASGLREVTIFKVVCPIPLQEVRQMCHILLMQMMPSVLEGELEMFGRALEDFQELGFKVFELRAQTQLLYDCLTFLKDNGGIGAGMSSWGPALYAFGEDLSELHRKTEEWLASRGGGKAILTKANNTGMRLVKEA
jgi:beta-ribofuranosylaminobenzene 5'-phosphate synthase